MKMKRRKSYRLKYFSFSKKHTLRIKVYKKKSCASSMYSRTFGDTFNDILEISKANKNSHNANFVVVEEAKSPHFSSEFPISCTGFYVQLGGMEEILLT